MPLTPSSWSPIDTRCRLPHVVELGADGRRLGQRVQRAGLERAGQEGRELGLAEGGEHSLPGELQCSG